MYSTLERFLKYVTYDTQSVQDAPTVPSTPGQLVLAKEMGAELRALGLKGCRTVPPRTHGLPNPPALSRRVTAVCG